MSDDPRKDLPPPSSGNFLARVRETLQVYLGSQGSLLDRGVTLRDLLDAGMIKLRPGFLSRGGPSPVAGIGSAVEGAYEVDLTPPPQPTGFAVSAAISHVFIEHDAPTYTQGHGHARTRVYGATWVSGPLPTFASAVEITQFTGQVFAHASNPATTWHLWIKWETKDGVLSVTPAGGTNGLAVTTGQDVALLLEALTGEIRASELHSTLGSRINLIDGGVSQPALAYPLAQIAAMQDALNQSVASDLNQLGTDLLTTVSTTSTTLQRITDAGVYVEPGTGLVKIYGLEQTKDRVTSTEVRLDAAEASITLKASVSYVDSQIAAATLQPADLLLYDGLDARLTTAELDIDGLQASVTLKAAQLDLDATNLRMTTAEADIDALEGQITLKVNQADFNSVTGGLDARLGSAETTLSAIGDTSSISSAVQQIASQARKENASAEALLRAILAGHTETLQRRDTIALAREDLTAYADAGVAAEAAQRLLLAVQVDANTAAITSEQVARADGDSANASSITTLSARVTTAEGDIDANTASIQSETSVRASETGHLGALYAVRVNLSSGGRQVMGGFGLAGTSSGTAGATIDFGVRADKFWVGAPNDGSGLADILPFVVNTTSVTVNGVTVSPGVYMDAAHIKNGTITNAKIGNAAIDDLKVANVSAAKLTAGSIAVGQYIQSTGYVAGSAGWRINGDGAAEFSGVLVRGTVYATAGQIGGNTIDASGLQSPGYAAGTSGWRLSSDGTGQIGGLTVGTNYIQSNNYVAGSAGWKLGNDGTLEASSGTFRGSLDVKSAASGARLEIKNNVLKVFDSSGVLRVRLGDLSA